MVGAWDIGLCDLASWLVANSQASENELFVYNFWYVSDTHPSPMPVG